MDFGKYMHNLEMFLLTFFSEMAAILDFYEMAAILKKSKMVAIYFVNNVFSILKEKGKLYAHFLKW